MDPTPLKHLQDEIASTQNQLKVHQEKLAELRKLFEKLCPHLHTTTVYDPAGDDGPEIVCDTCGTVVHQSLSTKPRKPQ